MDVSTELQLSTAQALEHLAEIMKRQPAYVAFMQAHQALQSDEEAQRYLKEGQRLGSQLQFDWSKEKQERFNTILDQFNQLACVKAYHEAELELRQLFCAVDVVISEAAGVEFAVNARRRSCCG